MYIYNRSKKNKNTINIMNYSPKRNIKNQLIIDEFDKQRKMNNMTEIKKGIIQKEEKEEIKEEIRGTKIIKERTEERELETQNTKKEEKETIIKNDGLDSEKFKVTKKINNTIKYIIICIIAIIAGLTISEYLNSKAVTDAQSIYCDSDKVGMSQRFKYWPAIVISESMEPAMMTYSISICETCTIDDLQVGDIVAFVHNNDIITHRVNRFTENMVGNKVIKTKGDNNPVEDSFEVEADMIQGKVIYTFNGTADIIKNYIGADNRLDTAAIMRTLIYLIAFTGISISLLIWLNEWISAIYIVKFKKNGYKNKIAEYENKLKKIVDCCELLGIEIEEESNNTTNNKKEKAHILEQYRKLSIIRDIELQLKNLKDLEKNKYINKINKDKK